MTPSPESAASPQAAAEDVNPLLLMVTQRDVESKAEYEHHLKLIHSHITQQAEDTSSDVVYYTRFVLKRSVHHPAVIQLTPSLDHELLQAQLNDVNVQTMIHILRDGELPPSHPNFDCQFFEKISNFWRTVVDYMNSTMSSTECTPTTTVNLRARKIWSLIVF